MSFERASIYLDYYIESIADKMAVKFFVNPSQDRIEWAEKIMQNMSASKGLEAYTEWRYGRIFSKEEFETMRFDHHDNTTFAQHWEFAHYERIAKRFNV